MEEHKENKNFEPPLNLDTACDESHDYEISCDLKSNQSQIQI